MNPRRLREPKNSYTNIKMTAEEKRRLVAVKERMNIPAITLVRNIVLRFLQMYEEDDVKATVWLMVDGKTGH